MIEMRRLKNVVIFVQTILSFVLSRKIIKNNILLFYSDPDTRPVFPGGSINIT